MGCVYEMKDCYRGNKVLFIHMTNPVELLDLLYALFSMNFVFVVLSFFTINLLVMGTRGSFSLYEK